MTSTTAHYHKEEKLRDGRTVVIRALVKADKPILKEGMHHLSPTSLYFRFLTPKKELTEKELIYFTEVDFFHHVALLASVMEDGVAVPAGVGRYVMADTSKTSKRAEIAFAVSEEYQHQGVATLLLKHLTGIAREASIQEFTALVLPDNRKMLNVFHHSQLPMETHLNTSGVLEVVLKLS